MVAKKLELHAVPGIPMVVPGDDLGALFAAALNSAGLKLLEGDVLVVAQKPVSKAENQIRRLSEVNATDEAIALAAETEKEPAVVQLILDESTRIVRHRPGVIIAEHRSGIVLANAGIDRSNVNDDTDCVLLLPQDSDASAARMRDHMNDEYRCRIGVVIADSVGRPWRMGTTGMALGAAGVETLANLRGQHDLFGRELQVSEHAIADSVAAAAELLMGEGDEATPLILVRGLAQGTATQDSSALLRPSHEDMFR